MLPTSPFSAGCAPCAPLVCPPGSVPGPKGDQGIAGDPGTDGVSAFTTVLAQFVMPNSGDDVTIFVGSTAWMAAGQIIYIESAGYFQLASITDSQDVIITNTGYNGNATPGTNIAIDSKVVASGPSGETGTPGTGVSSVALSMPSIFDTTGSPITSAGTFGVTLNSQSQNLVLAAPSASSGVPAFRLLVAADIPNIPASLIASGALPIARGGTGQGTAGQAFNALSPQTTKGDLVVGNGATSNTRIGVGSDGAVLTADSGTTLGLKWAAPAIAVTTKNTRVTTVTYSQVAVDVVLGIKYAGAQATTLVSAPADGRLVTIKDISGAGASNNITIFAGAGDTIEGSATKVITTNYGFRQLYYDATDAAWYIIGSA